MDKINNKLKKLPLIDLLQLKEATEITTEYFTNISESNRGIDGVVEDYNMANANVLKYTKLNNQILGEIKNKVDEYL